MPQVAGSDYDLIVVGSGAAGLAGAVTAATLGLSVAVVEKSGLVGGTTAMSGGGWWCPGNHHMGEVGLADSREEALEYLRACAPDTEPRLLDAIVDTAPKLARFLEDEAGVARQNPWPTRGGTNDYRPWLAGSRHGGRALYPPRFEMKALGEWAPKVRLGSVWTGDRLEYYARMLHLVRPSPETATAGASSAQQGDEVEAVASGTALVADLLRVCLAKGVDVHLSTRGRRLLVEEGRVVGIEAERDGGLLRFTARGGVLMASGGYAHNPELIKRWLRRPLEQTCEVAENVGDGHLMGIAAGADVANLGDAWWMPHTHIGFTGSGPMNPASLSREDRVLPHTLIVNRDGVRFVNEALNYYDFGDKLLETWQARPRHLPAWLIFDRQGVERYAMLQMKVGTGPTPEWLKTAGSVEELAHMTGVDAGALVATVTRFNTYALEGVDKEFGRGESGWDKSWADPDHLPNGSLGTVEKPPFYAVEVRGSALGTKGGLRVDDNARVLRAGIEEEAIPGLYASGNCSSGGPVGAYPGPGSTIGSAMTFGHLAARDVARRLAD
ncbi:FAD-dependent oxidoreductase [Streptomyces sp. NPDC057199]|uniref:FAD-dependent oxidoreductase n=1 Tax=Streptomyces sp. NPDC057199 TaxID=3346047 RepID=UPI0036446354